MGPYFLYTKVKFEDRYDKKLKTGVLVATDIIKKMFLRYLITNYLVNETQQQS